MGITVRHDGTEVVGRLRSFADMGLSIKEDVSQELKDKAKEFYTQVTKVEQKGAYLLNPKISGRLEASWDINTTGAERDAGEGEHTAGTPNVPENVKDVIFITNGCPYSGYVERGINPKAINSPKVQAHAYFTEKALDKVFK